jgi:tetratricopeptide (TPR) repeat protein
MAGRLVVPGSSSVRCRGIFRRPRFSHPSHRTPSQLRGRFRGAGTELETGDYQRSLQDIQQGLALGAGNDLRYESILRYHEVLLFTRNGEFESALSEYAWFSRTGIPNPELIIGIGLAGLRVPSLPKQVESSQRDLVLAAGNAAFHFMAGDQPKAQQEFHDLFQRFPQAPNAHYLYGYLLFAADPDQAVAEFRRELQLTPTNAAARVMLAWYFLLRNDAYQALPYAEAAVTEVPTAPSAQLVLGRSLVETGDLNDGIQHLDTALKLDLEIHLALVKGYSESGRKEDAMRERLQCIALTKGEAGAIARP